MNPLDQRWHKNYNTILFHHYNSFYPSDSIQHSYYETTCCIDHSRSKNVDLSSYLWYIFHKQWWYQLLYNSFGPLWFIVIREINELWQDKVLIKQPYHIYTQGWKPVKLFLYLGAYYWIKMIPRWGRKKQTIQYKFTKDKVLYSRYISFSKVFIGVLLFLTLLVYSLTYTKPKHKINNCKYLTELKDTLKRHQLTQHWFKTAYYVIKEKISLIIIIKKKLMLLNTLLTI